MVASPTGMSRWRPNLVALCVLLACGVECFENAANSLLFPGFEYESDIRHDVERDLFPFDGRSYFLPESASEDEFFRADFNLASLRPVSATPAFTLDPSYISPGEVFPARAKRRVKGKKAKPRRPEPEKEFLIDERDYGGDDEEEDDDGADEGKAHSEEDAGSGDVDDYTARYERFIAKHFDDLEEKRPKSAPQRKAPKSGAKPDEKDVEEDDDEDDDGDYKFDRVDYSSSEDYERIKAESEEQSRLLAKDPRNCRTYEKDGMVCSVCHDPASDSASESCAYATEPHHRKYAYVKERNYDSKKDDPNRANGSPMEARDPEDDPEDDEHGRAERQTDPATRGTPAPARVPPLPLRKPSLRTKPHQSATNGGGYRYQPVDLRSNRASSMKLRAPDDAPPAGQDANIYVMDYGEPDEVAKVLADFRSRDWSNCRKGKRMADDELTCYQCTDAAGVNHEECMYVSESRQVATGVVRAPASFRKRKKVVPLSRRELLALEPQLNDADDGEPAKEKQTVKRTVSFRSIVSGSGQGRSSVPLPSGDGSDASERVIRYEHHISHEVP